MKSIKVVWLSLVIVISIKSYAQIVPNDKEAIIKGLAALYNISIEEAAKKEIQIKNAIEFKNKYINLVEKANAPVVNWKKVGIGRFEFSFKSLIARPDNHPSNLVHGYLYVPSHLLNLKNPKKVVSTLIIHHIDDDIGPEKTLARIAKDENRGVFMLIYLPHYGLRKGKGSFISSSLEEFELNILQTLVDIQQSRLVLQSLNYVDKDKVQLMGISLGALIALVDAGFDSGFARYASLVGGADIAHVMSYRKEEDPDSETSKALADVHWSEEQGRDFLSRFDPMTWAYAISGKEFFFWNAEEDELMIRENCVERIANELRDSNNKVNLVYHTGKHRVDLKKMGYKNFYKEVFTPLMRFYSGKN